MQTFTLVFPLCVMGYIFSGPDQRVRGCQTVVSVVTWDTVLSYALIME